LEELQVSDLRRAVPSLVVLILLWAAVNQN
jgi:hypothetical protein